MRRTPVSELVIVLALGVVLATAMPAAASHRRTAATTLSIAGAILGGPFGSAACPHDAPAGSDCFVIDNAGVVRGLGNISETGVLVIKAPDTACEALQSTPVLTVAGKGTIDLSVRTPAGGCIDATCECGVLNATQDLTVTGGTGEYAGASGSGTVTIGGTVLSRQIDTLKATIVAPAANFDLTPPLFRGAYGRVVRAPKGERRVRVRYAVSARDGVDGAVRATCRPASGSLFRIGRTRVTCTATDSSANTAAASFTITVKP